MNGMHVRRPVTVPVLRTLRRQVLRPTRSPAADPDVFRTIAVTGTRANHSAVFAKRPQADEAIPREARYALGRTTRLLRRFAPRNDGKV